MLYFSGHIVAIMIGWVWVLASLLTMFAMFRIKTWRQKGGLCHCTRRVPWSVFLALYRHIIAAFASAGYEHLPIIWKAACLCNLDFMSDLVICDLRKGYDVIWNEVCFNQMGMMLFMVPSNHTATAVIKQHSFHIWSFCSREEYELSVCATHSEWLCECVIDEAQ